MQQPSEVGKLETLPAKWYAYFYDDKAYKALNAAMIEGDIEGKFEVNYISTDEFWD